MSLKQEIRSVSANLETPELLRYLIKERFPSETVVTASLMASSIVTLKMISEIDPATPIIFCYRPPVFKESIEYRAKIIDLLGLRNTSMNDGHEASVKPGDVDHCEHMWISCENVAGHSFAVLHLNDCLAPYRCWISAVYHVARPSYVRNRVDTEGRLIRVDPLIRWTQQDVQRYMRAHDLPYHAMAKRSFKPADDSGAIPHPTYDF